MKTKTINLLLILCVLSGSLCACQRYSLNVPTTANTTFTSSITTVTTAETPTTTSTTATTKAPTTTSTTTATTKAPTTIPSTANPTTTVQKHEYSEMEYEVFQLVNEERKKHGVQPLKLSQVFYSCAAIRAAEADALWSHTRPNGQHCSDVVYELGLEKQLRLYSENLGKTFQTAESIMTALMESEGHRANILYPDYNEIAVAIVPQSDCLGYYVLAQVFVQVKT